MGVEGLAQRIEGLDGIIQGCAGRVETSAMGVDP